MTKNFKCFLTILFVIGLIGLLSSCSQSMAILESATHAKGDIHLEGYFTDSQGDVVVCKVPEEYTAEQAAEFCNAE